MFQLRNAGQWIISRYDIMGQRTLAFTKQMLRVFNLVELEELYHLVANAWSSIPRSSETERNLFATHSEYKQTYICIRTLHHSNKNIIKHAKQNRARYYGHARKKKCRTRSDGRGKYRVYVKQILAITFNSTLSNINIIHQSVRLICYTNKCQLIK